MHSIPTYDQIAIEAAFPRITYSALGETQEEKTMQVPTI